MQLPAVLGIGYWDFGVCVVVISCSLPEFCKRAGGIEANWGNRAFGLQPTVVN